MKDGEEGIDMDELIDLSELSQVLQEYTREATEMYKYQLSLGGKSASRQLINSVTSELKIGENSFQVVLNLQHYWKYIEAGRKGKTSSPPGAMGRAAFPPVSAILDWILVKPILPRPSGKKLEKLRPKSLAYLIGRKIEQEGIPPFPALKATKEGLNDIYYERIAKALARDVGKYMQMVFSTE